MKNGIINTISKTYNKVNFGIKKHSPEILIVAGVVGTVASAVMACKATTKISVIMEKTKEDIDVIHNCMGNIETSSDEGTDEYTINDGKKDLAIVYVQTGMKLVKLYSPSIVLGALSLACIITSNNILRKRNIALAAAYATVDKSFKNYRKRVIERFGETVDRELKYNIKAKKFVETVMDENGEEKTVETTLNVVDPNAYSEYARFYDDGCKGWEKDPEYNLSFLRAQQQFANDRLKAYGYLFLNDVYDMLGIPRTKAGQVVGWIYDIDKPNGDNFVDFGIYEMDREANRNFVNGYERTILLDFNVDGYILDKEEYFNA